MKRIDFDQRAKLKNLLPSSEFLFGDKVTAVSKVLKDSMTVNPLAMRSFQPRGGGFARNFNKSKPTMGPTFKTKKFTRGGNGGGPRGGRGKHSAGRGERLKNFQE